MSDELDKLDSNLEEELDELIGEIPLYKNNKDWLEGLHREVLNKPIERNDINILRRDFSKLPTYLAYAAKLKGKAVALYRLAKLEAANKAKGLKAEERKAKIEGLAAQYKFLESYFDGIYDAIKERLKATTSIHSYLKEEMKNLPYEEV